VFRQQLRKHAVARVYDDELKVAARVLQMTFYQVHKIPCSKLMLKELQRTLLSVKGEVKNVWVATY
jgi:hypothetical protein